MGLLASCSAEVLSAALLLLLLSSRALSQCPAPILPPHSSVRGGGDLADTYPVGTALRLECIPGYEPRITPIMTCRNTNKWSDLPELCQGKQCPVPHLENGRVVDSDDLRFGEEITLACNYGFRIIGGNTRRCTLKSGKVDWDTELPFCERIPCVRPPVIPNGRYDPDPLDTYDTGSTVLYRCDPDYSLIGKSTITCTVEENGVDGKWDPSPPECKKVECRTPRIENGRVASVFQPIYTYQNKIPIECNPGYTLVGSSTIECGADSQWKSLPTCAKVSTTSKPTKSPIPTFPPTPQIPPRAGGTVFPKEDGAEVSTTSKPTKSPIPTFPPTPQIPPRAGGTVFPKEDGAEVSTTFKPTKSPTPTVPPTPQIPPRAGGTVSPKEDGTEVTAAPPTTSQTPTHESGAGSTVGIVFGAVIAVIVLAALIFAAVKWFSLQGKANTPHASTDSYHVVSVKDMTLEEKRAKD